MSGDELKPFNISGEADVETQDGGAEDDKPNPCAKCVCCNTTKRAIGCTCCLIWSFLVIFFAVSVMVGFVAAEEIVENHLRFEERLKDESGNLRTPSNMTRDMFFPDMYTETKSLIPAQMKAFNVAAAWKKVIFDSYPGDKGQETVKIHAWWLPVANPLAPRVVLVHGNNVNYNDWTVQIPAYMLRSMGFAVLLPNLRGHGASQAPSHQKISWGFEYHLDVMGAWHYAVSDPDNLLGGSISEGMVGIQGESMGGFASALAFGMLQKAPGLWLDSAVFKPKEVFEDGFVKDFGPAGPLFAEISWKMASLMVGVDLDLETVEDVLPSSKQPPRPVAVLHAIDDSEVPVQQAHSYIELFEKQPGYDLKIKYLPGKEGGVWGEFDHIGMLFKKPNHYREHMCSFWSSVFSLSTATCGINSLPDLETGR